MRIVLGVLAPDAGEVRFRGRPVDAAARTRFGYMPEERGLYPKMRVSDQLVHLARLHGLDHAAARSAAERWLERLGLGEVAARRTETLSLGNQQRAQLGAALVHDPELLVLDEPFSGLDPVGVDVLSEVLRERARAGVPVVFSSHQLELVERLCDAVAIVRAGQVVASGTVAALRAQRGGRRWRVDVDGDGGGGGAAGGAWLTGVAGATLVGGDDGAVVVELADDADEQALLDAARRAGRVRRFAPEEPTLADLFREAIA
jgi:ABC-2 type transport system ATP-binding protein